MKIFVSYASEHRSLAEALAAELTPLGHRVFLDRHNLPPGESYTDQIRKSIEQSDLFIFLISPEAVTPGRYTMSELQVMQETAPSPSGRVLPVMAAPTQMPDVPDYLRNVTILTPAGDLVTETLNAVAAGESRSKRRRQVKTAAVSFGLAAVAALVAAMVLKPPAQQTMVAPKAPFSVYGSNFVGHGQSAVVNVTNQRPDIYKDLKCIVDSRKMEANIASIEHDPACETITIKTKLRPFLQPDGGLIESISYDRTPLPIEIMWQHGQVIWRGEWQIGFQNFLDPARISLRKLDEAAGYLWFELLLDGSPFTDGYVCKANDEGTSFKNKSCVFKVTGYNAGQSTFAASVLLTHPETGWIQDFKIDNR